MADAAAAALTRVGRWRLASSVWGPALLARGLKHLLPLPQLIRLARATRPTALRPARAAAVVELLDPARPARLRMPGNCLDRSVALFRLLCRSEPELRLVVGARQGSRSLDGHVWLTLHGAPLWDSPEWLASFRPVIVFDAQGNPSRRDA